MCMMCAKGKLVADNLVEDDATLQMGIGAIPNAMLSSLGNHKVYVLTDRYTDIVLLKE